MERKSVLADLKALDARRRELYPNSPVINPKAEVTAATPPAIDLSRPWGFKQNGEKKRIMTAANTRDFLMLDLTTRKFYGFSRNADAWYEVEFS